MKKRVIQVPMPPDLLAELDAAAQRKGESRSAFIREACEQYVAAGRTLDADLRYEDAYRRFPEDLELAEALEAASAEALKDDPW